MPISTRRRLHPRLRRVAPALVVLLVVAVVLCQWTGSVAADAWRDSLDGRLADAGAGLNTAVLDVERDQLMALRAFSYTSGVDEAIDVEDVEAIQALLGPVDANLGIPMVDVLDENGRVLFAFRAEGLTPPTYRQRADLGIVQRALRDEPDVYGDRFTTLAVTDEGPLLASAGPVRIDDRVVGAIVLMTPLADLITTATNADGEMLTVYSGDGGVALATSAPVKPRTLPEAFARLLPAADLPVVASFDVPGEGEARERLGALVVRHEPVAWLGVADLDRSNNIAFRVETLTALAIVLCSWLAAGAAILWSSTASTSERERDEARARRANVGRRAVPALPAPEANPLSKPVGVADRVRK